MRQKTKRVFIHNCSQTSNQTRTGRERDKKSFTQSDDQALHAKRSTLRMFDTDQFIIEHTRFRGFPQLN